MSRAGDAFRTVAKQAAKTAAKSCLRYLVATFGLPAVAISAAAILVLIVIYAVLPASGVPGSNMDTRAKAVAYYQDVTQQVNPKPRVSLYPELEQSHMLNFGLLYAVDFFANNLSGVNKFQSNLTLFSKVDTYQGIYTYTYKTYEYVLHPTPNEIIIIDTWQLAESKCSEDWTRFNAIVEKYTGLAQVTTDDREMILQSAVTLQTGTAVLARMDGAPEDRLPR